MSATLGGGTNRPEPEELEEKLRRRLHGKQIDAHHATSEQEIAFQLGTDRARVRLIASKLQDRGLVIRTPRGLKLRESDETEIDEMLAVRDQMEPAIVRRLCKEGDSVRNRIVHALRMLIDQQEQAATANDPFAFLERGIKFHVEMAKQYFPKFAEHLGESLEVVYITGPTAAATTDTALILSEHRDIVDAIEQGVEVAAVDAIKLHLKHSAERLNLAISS